MFFAKGKKLVCSHSEFPSRYWTSILCVKNQKEPDRKQVNLIPRKKHLLSIEFLDLFKKVHLAGCCLTVLRRNESNRHRFARTIKSFRGTLMTSQTGLHNFLSAPENNCFCCSEVIKQLIKKFCCYF